MQITKDKNASINMIASIISILVAFGGASLYWLHWHHDTFASKKEVEEIKRELLINSLDAQIHAITTDRMHHDIYLRNKLKLSEGEKRRIVEHEKIKLQLEFKRNDLKQNKQ